MNNLFSRIPKEYWAYLALAVWGALVFILLNKTIYGLDEGAAHALLLVWSVSDGVVSSIVTLGLPDFRTLFFIPPGVLFTGNVLAAKMATMLVMAITAWALHSWRQQKHDTESSLLATGLLLISPLLLSQIDTMSVAPFLLLTFVLGAWADQNYRAAKLAFGGMYFAQIFLCLIGISLHPAGFAYPLALLWTWYKNPLDKEHRKYMFIGTGAVIVIALALTSGWRHVELFLNPIRALSDMLFGPDGDMGVSRWIAGIVMACLLLWVLAKQAVQLWGDMLGRILVLALAIGLLSGDQLFGVIALVICLYWGLPLLLSRPVNPESGFWGQRGAALVVVFLVSTVFMINDRGYYETRLIDQLSARDTLIKALAEDGGYFMKNEPQPANEHGNVATPDDETRHARSLTPVPPLPQGEEYGSSLRESQGNQGKDVRKRLRVASQWPGLTMLACKCDALPLPPEAHDSDALLAMLKGVDYLLFDPRDPANRSLSHNLSTMDAGRVETVDLKPGGVIVLIKNRVQAGK